MSQLNSQQVQDHLQIHNHLFTFKIPRQYISDTFDDGKSIVTYPTQSIVDLIFGNGIDNNFMIKQALLTPLPTRGKQRLAQYMGEAYKLGFIRYILHRKVIQ